jgi:hypothetical protein
LMVAVPALVNCAVPRIWMSVQCAAVASQKFTWPAVTTVPPAFTVAVSVTTVPVTTVETVPPPDVTAKVVVVTVGLPAAGTVASNQAPHSIK